MSGLKYLTIGFLISMFFSISSCTANGYTDSKDAEVEFYEFYPELRNKSHNLHTYAEGTVFREVIRYYRLEISAQDAKATLEKVGFINVDLLPLRTTTTLDENGVEKKKRGEKIKCDSNFIELVGGSQYYRKWWDIQFSPQTTCYLIPPENSHRISQAIFDPSRNMLYIHSYRAW
jgi:hypothetical protein